MTNIDQDELAKKYNSIQEIWSEEDKWHLRLKIMIDSFVLDFKNDHPLQESIAILNAGSAGYSYGFEEINMLHVDIAGDKISHLPHFLISTIENMPVDNERFDLIICLGTVINYCDPIKVFSEFNRVLKKGGYLLIDFENSRTFELIGTKEFNKNAAFVETFYNKQIEKMWYFSESFIRNLSGTLNFNILNFNRCHYISPLIYKFSKNENAAAWFSRFDAFFSFIPIFNKICANVIFALQKE